MARDFKGKPIRGSAAEYRKRQDRKVRRSIARGLLLSRIIGRYGTSYVALLRMLGRSGQRPDRMIFAFDVHGAHLKRQKYIRQGGKG